MNQNSIATEFVQDPCRAALAQLLHKAMVQLLPPGQDCPAEWLGGGIGRLLEKPPEQELGDFALPCFRFAKPLGKKPADIAAAVGEHLSTHGEPWVARCEVVGAFLNIFVNKTEMARLVIPRALSGEWFTTLAKRPGPQSTRVMIEHSQPNTHKEFHIGHARNVCLGLSLVNLYRYSGYQVTAANYIGDEGTHIAKCLWWMRKSGSTPPATARGEWLGTMYASATRKLAELSGEDLTRAEKEISEILRAIESKNGPIFELWKETRQWSLDDFDVIYDWLGVKFERVFFESEVSEESQTIVDEYLAKKVFVESDGAIGSDLKEHKLGFMIVRKRDGNTLYATKDLALARRKFDEFHIDRSVYVVAAEQNFHFRQVFKTLELMGFAQARKCFHLSYGMVMLPEGKMSSRDGTSVSFVSLRDKIEAALREHLDKYRDTWSPDEIRAVSKDLCEGAIKYGMLHTDPVKDIIFDPAAWISFEGNSGPYLMYSHARTRSVLRKAADAGASQDPTALDKLTEPSEHALIRFVYDFNDVVESAAENYKPSLVATHLFYMCKAFNRFYAEVPVLKAEGVTRGARLALIAAFAETLRRGLGLLGMAAPEKM